MTASDRKSEQRKKSELRELDGILPGEVNRRKFFKASVATIVGGSFAGCIGGGSNQTSGDTAADQQGASENTSGGSDKKIIRNVIWRTALSASPNYAPDYAAQLQGFWTKQNIAPPTVREGFGSGDTVKRIGTGKETFGEASIIPMVSGLAQGYNLTMFGTAKARTYFALIWRSDKINGLNDLSGKTVAVPTITELIWNQFSKAIGAPDDVNAKVTDISTANALFIEGEVDAIMETLNGYGPFQRKIDPELSLELVYNHTPIYGYTTIVNNGFLNESDMNREYATRVLEGYSQALKWVMLNPEKAVDMMVNDVNPSLKTKSREDLLDQIRGGVASANLADDVLKNGLGHLSKKRLQESLTTLASGMQGVSKTPSIKNAADFSIQENADLAMLSSNEESQVREFAKPYPGFFE